MNNKPELKDKKVIFESKKVENFFGEDFISSSADLIAVKYGIKKVTRLEYDEENFKKIKKNLEENSLKLVLSDEKLFGKFHIYVSKSKKLATEAKKVDPSFKIINHQKMFSEVVDDVYRFSKLLSYPECCIKEYIKNTLNNVKVSTAKAFLQLPKKINFLFNNILNGVSNHYLSFHFPCSFNCKNTLIYQKRIFDKIKQDSPLFAQSLENYLRNPYLVFLDATLDNIYVSWDNRKGFIFNGKVQGNELSYSQIIYFKTHYPDYENSEIKNKELTLLFNKIAEGNRIIFKNDGFEVFRDKSLLYRFKNKESLRAYLFNFV